MTLEDYFLKRSEKIKIKDLAYKISRISKKKIIIKKTSLAKGSAKIRIPNINKMRKLGFKPKLNLENSEIISLKTKNNFSKENIKLRKIIKPSTKEQELHRAYIKKNLSKNFFY